MTETNYICFPSENEFKPELKSGCSHMNGDVMLDRKEKTNLFIFLLFFLRLCVPFRQFMQFLQAISEPWAVVEHLQQQLMSVIRHKYTVDEQSP